MSSTLHDRTAYLARLGDPKTWEGEDWSKPGRDPRDKFREGHYPVGEKATEVRTRLQVHEAMIVGMAVRRARSSLIAAVLCVSRESIDRRLRPRGFKNAPGQFGRPPVVKVGLA